MTRTCSDCPSPISKGSVNGRCRRCANTLRNRSPEMRAHASRQMKEARAAGKLVVPAEVRSAAMKRHIAENPSAIARLVEMGRKGAAVINANPEIVRRRADKQSATMQRKRRDRLAWCPEDRRDELERLRSALGVAEAERIMREDLARIEARRVASLSYEDRIAERLARGATVTVRRPMPSREHAFSLTGSGLA